MKNCRVCKLDKQEAEFPANKTASGVVYLHTACRDCRREQCRAWSKTDGGRAVKRRGVLRRHYGITHEQYDAMRMAQAGVCAICEQPETKVLRGKVLRLSVDHDHATGAVRSLLCQACNVGLGSFASDADRLRKAARYIAHHHYHQHHRQARQQGAA